MIAQAGPGAGETTAVAVLTALLILYVVATLFLAFKHRAFAAIPQVLIMFTFLYVGWAIRGWPGVDESDGLLLGLWEAWLGSLRVAWDFFYDVSGLDSLAARIGVSGT